MPTRYQFSNNSLQSECGPKNQICHHFSHWLLFILRYRPLNEAFKEILVKSCPNVLPFTSGKRDIDQSCRDIHASACKDLVAANSSVCQNACGKSLCPFSCGTCSKYFSYLGLK